MEELDKNVRGIRIGGEKFNAFGYADDALLTSVTATGLQALITCAVNYMYVSKYGLSFNPVKTNCLIRGRCPFATLSVWYINGIELAVKDEINYLGVILSTGHGTVTFHQGLVQEGKLISSCKMLVCKNKGLGLKLL